MSSNLLRALHTALLLVPESFTSKVGNEWEKNLHHILLLASIFLFLSSPKMAMEDSPWVTVNVFRIEMSQTMSNYLSLGYFGIKGVLKIAG